jgi:hypothetical protein
MTFIGIVKAVMLIRGDEPQLIGPGLPPRMPIHDPNPRDPNRLVAVPIGLSVTRKLVAHLATKLPPAYRSIGMSKRWKAHATQAAVPGHQDCRDMAVIAPRLIDVWRAPGNVGFVEPNPYAQHLCASSPTSNPNARQLPSVRLTNIRQAGLRVIAPKPLCFYSLNRHTSSI